jgi:UMF1 family MFS transporter
MLIDVAESEQYDFVSSLGFSIGYLGCGILFLFNLIMLKNPELFGLVSKAQVVKISFLLVSIWWFIFSLPLLFIVKPRSTTIKIAFVPFVVSGLERLFKIMTEIIKDKNTLLFFIAYFFYIDGVHTIVMMATDFGLSIGIKIDTLMLALLWVQFVAFPAALGFGFLSRKIGAKPIVLIAIGIYILISLGGAWIISTGTHFIIFACITGTAQGAIQALSRSLFANMIPEDKETDYFGFYNMIGKFSVVLGPGLVALCNIIAYYIGFESKNASRFGISILAILFVIGFIILSKVRVLKTVTEKH